MTGGATDIAGNGLAPFSSTFTTAAAPAIGSPTITALTPPDGAAKIATSISPLLTFSETMNLGTINSSTLTLAPSGGGSNIPGDITFHGNNRVFFESGADRWRFFHRSGRELQRVNQRRHTHAFFGTGLRRELYDRFNVSRH